MSPPLASLNPLNELNGTTQRFSDPSHRVQCLDFTLRMLVVPPSAEDAESKPSPDVFEIVLKKLKIEGADAMAIGDTSYDAEAARKAGIQTIGVLSGGFSEGSLRAGGCVEVYPGPATLFARFGGSRGRPLTYQTSLAS
jgi:hypothetical protein